MLQGCCKYRVDVTVKDVQDMTVRWIVVIAYSVPFVTCLYRSFCLMPASKCFCMSQTKWSLSRG